VRTFSKRFPNAVSCGRLDLRRSEKLSPRYPKVNRLQLPPNV